MQVYQMGKTRPLLDPPPRRSVPDSDTAQTVELLEKLGVDVVSYF